MQKIRRLAVKSFVYFVLFCLVFFIFFTSRLLASVIHILPDSTYAWELEQQELEGMMGTLYVPSVSMEVDIYQLPDPMAVQEYTDRDNCAVCLFREGTIPLLADHNYQGFFGLPDVELGTLAYINNLDAEQKVMRCVSVEYGFNDGLDIYDEDGICWDDWGKDCDLAMYTCQPQKNDWHQVIVTKWRYVYFLEVPDFA